MAHHVAAFRRTAEAHVDRLAVERRAALEPSIGKYLDDYLPGRRNPNYRGSKVRPPDFDPARDTVEGRYLSAGGPDDYDEYFGLAPVSTRPTLLCGHEPQPEVPHWIVSHNGEEVYTREGELLEDEGDEEGDSEYTDAG